MKAVKTGDSLSTQQTLPLAVESGTDIDGQAVPKPEVSGLDWPPHDVGPWLEGLSLRREDLYGDFGR